MITIREINVIMNVSLYLAHISSFVAVNVSRTTPPAYKFDFSRIFVYQFPH
mgnify:CR=1 FL=1